MRERLAGSLRYIVDEACAPLELERSLLEPFLGRLAAGRVPPLAFGAYAELVPALERGRLERARELLLELVAMPNHEGTVRIVDFAPGLERYHRLTDTDPAAPFAMLPPVPWLTDAARRVIGEALALLKRGAPAYEREIRGLLCEIVLAAGPDDGRATTFDGASSFMLWGAVIVNVGFARDLLDMLQTLVHECSHNVLFGLCADGPLVDNDDEERFGSPLREDPRPMDGIVHAAWVAARVHHVLAQVASAGVLQPLAAQQARAAQERWEAAFAATLGVIDRHARLTSLGRAVIARAHQWMAGRGSAAIGPRADAL